MSCPLYSAMLEDGETWFRLTDAEASTLEAENKIHSCSQKETHTNRYVCNPNTFHPIATWGEIERRLTEMRSEP